MMTEEPDEASTGEMTLAILQHDPAWAWLHDPDEDINTWTDVQAAPTV
jgi:hypothetical protein